MKKIIKIFTLILLIVLFFGITTSNAATMTVDENTSAADMIAFLDANPGNNYLKGISETVRKGNAYLYCRQYNTSQNNDATYTWANGTKENSIQVYPGTDANGYAKAYILAGGDYIKHSSDDKSNERQWAWWQILGQVSGKNNVYIAAEAYQKFKTEGKDVTVETKNAKSIVTETNAIYGPITVEYSYFSGMGYSFGGFNYAFFNTNGENVSDKVELYTLLEDTYIPITSTEGTNGYRNVRSISYNKVNLYIVTQDKTLQKVNMKIQTNSLECEASVYDLQGTYKTSGHRNYCMGCAEKAYASIIDAYKNKGYFVASDGNYYKYADKMEIEKTYKCSKYAYKSNKYICSGYKTIYGSTGTWNATHYSLGNETISYSSTYTEKQVVDELNGRQLQIGFNGEFPICNICGHVFPNMTEDLQYSHLFDHVQIVGTYTTTTYYFEQYNGCGTEGCGKWVEPEDNYEAQRLLIVDTATSTEECEISVEMDILFIPSIKIELGKYNSYGATTHTGLTGAEYTVQAMQNGKVICSKAGAKSGEIIDIMPSTYDNVYIKITETKAPNGYIMIGAPINAIMSIDAAKTQWYPSFAPNEEAWNASGFDSSTWGNWTYVDDGSVAFPNDYMSQNGDYVNVSVTSGNGSFAFKVSAYNEPKINKLELFKVDGTNQAVLAGAKFKATLSNVKTITINGREIEVTAETEIDLETDANGKCLIDAIKLIDENEPVIITINEVQVPSANSQDYYYKKLSSPIVITVTHTPNGLQVECSYDGIEEITAVQKSDDKYSISITIPNIRVIDISGKVWLDEQEGIKPATLPDGYIDTNEQLLSGIKVKLYMQGTDELIQETVTDSNGEYKFENVTAGKSYNVVFEYDGINYESTVIGGDSKADENETERTNFNNKFTTINYKQAIGTNGGTTALTYDYNQETSKSTLNTTNEDGTIKEEFKMNSSTSEVSNGYMTLNKNTVGVNFGLVKRETDMALSTDVSSAIVTINGQETEYKYNQEDNTITIDNTTSIEEVLYNLNLYASDYNYRIRDYVSNVGFTSKDKAPIGAETGDTLKVSVIYELNLQNQSNETVIINEVKYSYDTKYTFVGFTDNTYNDKTQHSGNELTINLDGLKLTYGETKSLYLEFTVNDNNGLVTGDFYNKAEITSYSTERGLIDIDSQPGNCFNDNQHEDDCRTAGGLKVQVIDDERIVSGKVFDKDNSQTPVDDVIVQLIELKEVNGKVYEYIWQETVSGSGQGKIISMQPNAEGDFYIHNYEYSVENGYYEFRGFIPGDYIVRFIYGDGTTYDMTNNVIKYNGQDYKSTIDQYYNQEWYNTNIGNYAEGASVARDNEARRLETMAYSVNMDAEKGLLLKLLDNKDLNLTEKETLISIYNKYYDTSDITYTDITEVSDEIIAVVTQALLKLEVLPNTWMCAETSKIKVPVATQDNTNTDIKTVVDGINVTYIFDLQNINLGLELRPETQIELKKYITSMKLTAVNGQTIVNAFMDIEAAKQYAQDNNTTLEAYLGNTNNLQGIRDNLIILGRNWQWDGVSPTEIYTVLDGANLEFVYTFVIENTGDSDYLSNTLVEAYNSGIENYINTLNSTASNIKTAIRTSGYNSGIGGALGTSYYAGGTSGSTVATEITHIRDYLNNELSPVANGDVEKDEEASGKTYRILTESYEMQEATIDTVLKTTRTTGKMIPGANEVMYNVTLSKNQISSSGNLYFDTYIAEVISYTNAAGRRAMTSTPGNAEIIDEEKREGREHEIDESYAGNVKLMASAGEDQVTNYIIIIAVAAGIALVAIGVFVVKKYIIK